jgi:hypothetical protein
MLRFDVGEDLLHYYCNVHRVTVYATAPVNVAVGARILRQIGAGARDGGQEPRAGSIELAEAGYRAAIGGTVAAAYPVPDMPSIAVLPFKSMSADGMVEHIITGLSRILWLFVIARNSRLTYSKSLYARALSDREPVSFASTKRLKIWTICSACCCVNLLPKCMIFYELFSKSRRCLPNNASPNRPARIARHSA